MSSTVSSVVSGFTVAASASSLSLRSMSSYRYSLTVSFMGKGRSPRILMISGRPMDSLRRSSSARLKNDEGGYLRFNEMLLFGEHCFGFVIALHHDGAHFSVDFGIGLLGVRLLILIL